MIAYKAFRPGLVCLGYQFKMGCNETPEANCAQNGFHCAENPLDCLTYYRDIEHSEYYVVDAGGDIDEDDIDSKISCTRLTIRKRLTPDQLILHGLAYMVDHPERQLSSQVSRNKAEVGVHSYAVVRGADPLAKGEKGAILAFAKEDSNGRIVKIAVGTVDGKKLMPNVWYDADFRERRTAV